MVLKNFVRFLINKFLKDYIEELDYERLKLDLKHGQVCLEQLHLKPEALTDLSLPVTVASGYLEKITLTIPWKNLYSHPTKVSIDGLYMLVVPKNEVRRDLTEYHADKMRRVQRKVDNLRKAASTYQKADEKETTFFERMKLQIMQNLRITLRNLHISYETISTTKLGHPFSFGLTIHWLEMTTTTNLTSVGKVKENSLVIFQMKEIHSLALYWNTQCQSRIDLSFEQVIKDLKSKIATDTYRPETDEMNYLLHPMNLMMDFKLALQPGKFNFERPAYDIDIQIEQMSLTIDPKQFSDLLDFIKFQNYSILYDRCREYRQLQLQQALGLIEFTPEQKQRLQILETKLDVFNLAYIRHSVEMEVNAMSKQQEENATTTASSSDKTAHHQKRWNSLWKSKHLRRLSSINNDEPSMTDDSPNIDVKIQVHNLVLNLSLPSTQFEKEILCPIQIVNAEINFKRRAVSSNILFVIDLQSFSIYGMKDKRQNRPFLVTSHASSSSAQMHAEFELFPIDKRSDYRFNLVIQPLKIAYDAPTINQIVAYFDPNDENLSSLSLPIQHRTAAQMEEDLRQAKVFDLTVRLHGIALLLPENGVMYNSSSMVHVDFDGLFFHSCLNEENKDQKRFTTEERQLIKFYKKYQVQFHNLRVTYSHSNRIQWHLIQRIPLLDMIFYKCIYSDDAQLIDWRIFISIRQLDQIEFSQMMLSKLISHLKSIPSLYATMMETLRRINLYFTIFLPQTSIQCDLFIKQCLLLLPRIHTSIRTDVSGRVLKTREINDPKKDMNLVLNNLTVSYEPTSDKKLSSSWLMYRYKFIRLIYNHHEVTPF